ncbi:unnamed protein product [Plutella xylostella]|uniref:(diamondback moth) hypothetical protein n=1 Tax=Plutella xylostella TaxID=51655 RepID=A0A8S4F8V3_PLUXY|nr:unnamed protein product [Plutella xylostella]
MHPTIDNFSESQKEVHTIDIDTEIQNIDSIIETEDKIKKIDELFQVQTEVGFVIEMTADVACDVAEQSATSRRHVDDMCLDRFCDNLSPSEYEALNVSCKLSSETAHSCNVS